MQQQSNDTAPQAPLELHGAIDQATFELIQRLQQEFALSTGSAMVMAFDSLCAHMAAGAGGHRKRALAELLRVSARRVSLGATAPAKVQANQERDFAAANTAMLVAIEASLARARDHAAGVKST